MNDFKTSPNGRKFIELWEGCVLHSYQDQGGVWTIGFGHTSAAGLPRVRAGMVIERTEADAILAADLATMEADVNHHITASINQNQFDALVSFDYNTGALDRSSLMRSINTGQIDFVKHDLEAWDHVAGIVNSGLLRRRNAEFILFSTGEVTGP